MPQIKLYDPPENAEKPSFLQDKILLSSQQIPLERINASYEGIILGYTIKGTDKKYITMYVENNSFGVLGYVSRTYKFYPDVNTKGEFYRLMQRFNITQDQEFNKFNNQLIKYKTYYSTDRDKKYKKNQDGFIYVNFSTTFETTSTQQIQIPVTQNPTPAPIENGDYKICANCGKKVSNYVAHLESGCLEYIVD